MKIISLIPSATEIVCSLGLFDKLIGVSHECDNPKHVLNLPRLTKSNIKLNQSSLDINTEIKKCLSLGLSVYDVDTELLKNLNPDIIITQSQCSVCAVSLSQIEICLESWLGRKPLLIDLQPKKLNDILNDIKQIGINCGALEKAKSIINTYNSYVKEVKIKLKNTKRKNVLCVEWLDPIMIAGNWVPELVKLAKGKSVFANSGEHSKFIKIEELKFSEFEKVIYMPCGYDILKSKNELLSHNFLDKKLSSKENYIVDGNKYFNRPGPSLTENINILCEILHPNLFKPNPSSKRWIKI